MIDAVTAELQGRLRVVLLDQSLACRSLVLEGFGVSHWMAPMMYK